MVRELLAWGLGIVMTIVAAVSGWLLYHDRFASNKTVESVRAEAQAKAAAIFLTVKNIQRGRLAAYDDVPNNDLSEHEKRDKLIIEYDLKNIEVIEQGAGLKTP